MGGGKGTFLSMEDLLAVVALEGLRSRPVEEALDDLRSDFEDVDIVQCYRSM